MNAIVVHRFQKLICMYLVGIRLLSDRPCKHLLYEETMWVRSFEDEHFLPFEDVKKRTLNQLKRRHDARALNFTIYQKRCNAEEERHSPLIKNGVKIPLGTLSEAACTPRLFRRRKSRAARAPVCNVMSYFVVLGAINTCRSSITALFVAETFYGSVSFSAYCFRKIIKTKLDLKVWPVRKFLVAFLEHETFFNIAA